VEFHRGGADIGVLSWGRRTSIESAHGRPPGAKSFFVPALVIAWTWRFWIFLAALLSALVPFYKTHFFDPLAAMCPFACANLWQRARWRGLFTAL